MSLPPSWLPPLIHFADSGNVWQNYEELLYSEFRSAFPLPSVVSFRGKPLVVGNQIIEGRLRTFWHLISEGEVERNRTPDFCRCERIRWARAIIDHDGDPAIWSWPNQRGRNTRQVLWVPSAAFAVILESRPAYWMLWTTYCTNWPKKHEKFEREYREYLDSVEKANAAP